MYKYIIFVCLMQFYVIDKGRPEEDAVNSSFRSL